MNLFNLFRSASARRPANVRRSSFRPTIESLETRQLLSAQLIPSLPMPASLPAVHGPINQVAPVLSLDYGEVFTASQTMNQQILNFCKTHLGQKVGGGECAHLANEALRVAGASFTGSDPHHNGDYVWGTLITQITAHGGHRADSNPSVAVRPGDIIQFQNAYLSNGASYPQHTAIVASVDSHGRPTAVYEQNVGVNGKGKTGVHDRFVKLDPINLNTMVSGTVHIYRAVARKDAPGEVQYSVVNDTHQVQTVTISHNGKPVTTMTLDTFNTLNSYRDGYVQSSSGGNWTISVGRSTVALHNACGYEVYTTANGQAAIRQI
jgi:hypothetical protein